MDAVVRKADKSKDFDDSGCVQDDSLSRKELDSSMEETQLTSSTMYDEQPSMLDEQRAGLLDLSDDVLLCILKYCSPRDLKALGYTCPRLGTLILDHTLWTNVNVGQEPCGVARLKWLTEHALNPGTRSLQLCGLAREAQGCLGYINRSKPIKKAFEERNEEIKQDDVKVPNSAGVETCRKRTQTDPSTPCQNRLPAHLHIWSSSARQLPRFTQSPYWPKEAEEDNMSTPSEHGCFGPVFTLTPSLLTALRTQCQLHTLHLHYANINCTTTSLAQFPKKLKSLSLRGTKCYNMAMDSSFLSKINDLLPELEHVDISKCEWVDPAVLIPLSKLPVLKRLEIRNCHRMCEFIAYGSLAARYGFKQLESLDVRGSPLGESEVSPFAYVSTLRELYLSSNRSPLSSPTANRHAHYRDEPRGVATELEDWEKEVPYYYRTRPERPLTPEPETLPRNTTVDSPHIRPSNIFTVTLSRNSAPVIEHIAPENLHQFLISQNMIAVNVNENNVPNPNAVLVSPEGQIGLAEHEPLVKRQRTDEGSSDGGEEQNGDSSQDKRCSTQDGRSAQDGCSGQDGRSGQDVVENKAAAFTGENEDESAIPLKKRKLNDFNIRPSTSLSVEIPSTSKETPKEVGFVKFRRNEPPTVVSKDETADKRETPKKVHKEVLLRRMLEENVPQDEQYNLPGTSKDTTQETDAKKPVTKVDKGCDSLLREIKRSYSQSIANNMRRAAEQIDNERFNHNLQQAEAEQQRAEAAQQRAEAAQQRAEADPQRAEAVPQRAEANQQRQEANPQRAVPEIRRPNNMHDDLRVINLQNRIRMSYLSNIYYTPAARSVDPTTLVTDACIKMFGSSDNDDVNYVHIGPNGAFFVGRGHENGNKPPKSNLRKLVCNNYSGITNSALDHLATAAPLIEYIDFRGTNVTAQGVEEFKSLKPDVTVLFEQFKKTERSETP